MRREPWQPVRLLHRQMYIDLIRAYLAEYGSQRKLARSLGVEEAFVSALLRPAQPWWKARLGEHWSVLARAEGYEIAEAFKIAKTPSVERAHQIAAQLCSEAERRDVLLHHVDLARRASAPPRGDVASLPAEEARAALGSIGESHQTALYDSSPLATSTAYAQVWDSARHLTQLIDPERAPLEYAQSLIFAHDAAQVLNRHDLALGYARSATLVLSSVEAPRRAADEARRLRINAILAEVVSLNTLGLASDAKALAEHAELTPEHSIEPQHWKRSFLEQRLTAMAGIPPRYIKIYDAQKIAEQALELVPEEKGLSVGIDGRFLDVCLAHYLAYGGVRRKREMARLADQLRTTMSETTIGALRQAIYLRTLFKYLCAIGDSQSATATAVNCLHLTEEGNLTHQRNALLADIDRQTLRR